MQNLLVLKKELLYAESVELISCVQFSAVKYFNSLLCFYHRIKKHIVQAVKRSLMPTETISSLTEQKANAFN